MSVLPRPVICCPLCILAGCGIQRCQRKKQLLVAREQDRIVGTIIVALGMMPNGRHRAEISKLLVHPDARRKGIARQLMLQAEQIAIKANRTLLVLDTRSGDIAETLYQSLGWQVAGMIPDYALSTTGVLDATTIMYKRPGNKNG